VIKPRSVGLADSVVRMAEKRNEYRVLVGKPDVACKQVSTILLHIKRLEQMCFLCCNAEYHNVSKKEDSVAFCKIDIS
jgi:hypothetical protein